MQIIAKFKLEEVLDKKQASRIPCDLLVQEVEIVILENQSAQDVIKIVQKKLHRENISVKR